LAMVVYAFKRVIRSWKLFLALMLGVILASSFFAGINISIDSLGVKSLNQQLEQTYADIVVSTPSNPLLSPQNITYLENLILNVSGVKNTGIISRVVSVAARPINFRLPDGSEVNYTQGVSGIIGVSAGSYIYENMILDTGDKGVPGENETFIEIDSELAPLLHVGDAINVTIPVRVGAKPYTVVRNLTVAGFISMDDRAFSMVLGRYTIPLTPLVSTSALRRVDHNFLLVDWNKTFADILGEVYSNASASSVTPFSTDLVVSLDRILLNPFDLEGSRSNLNTVTSTMTIAISVYFSRITSRNNLVDALNSYESTSTLLLLYGILLSLPVFFVAWYVGLTVSDVAFQLRRREIGLLLTKGFTSRQLLRLFLMEAIFIGAIGAASGLALGAIFTPIFTMGQFTSLPIINLDTVIFVAIFSVAIALLAVFQPARKAANFKPLETVREYFRTEEAKPHRKIWVWIAFILGSYKIVMLLLGLNLETLLSQAGSILGPTVTAQAGRGGGFILTLLQRIAIFIDANVLLYLGPILFFWSFSKIFIAGSLQFQNAMGKVTKFFVKDLSLLAERNIQRNAARVASTTFLLAIIMGYGVTAVGQIASQNDYIMRIIYSTVGADLNILPETLDNVTSIKNELLTNITGVENIAVQYTGFSGRTALETDSGTTRLIAIEPEEWLKVAFYEQDFFIGDTPADQMIRALSNETIILASRFSTLVKAGGNVSLTIGQKSFNLKILGFYGLNPSSLSSSQRSLLAAFPSYINESIYQQINGTVSSTAQILAKLQPSVNGENIAEQVRDLPDVQWVTSAAEQIRVRDQNVLVSGPLNILKLGVFFAALAASIGTSLVTFVTMQERRKETTLLMVRGMSVRQVLITFLTESFGALLVAGLMGSFVGYLIDRGNVEASRFASLSVAPRVIFPFDATMTIAIIFSLLVVSVVLPVIVIVILRSSKLVWRT